MPKTRLRNALMQAKSSAAPVAFVPAASSRAAPEVVPADDDQQRGNQVRRVADELKGELGEKRADAARRNWKAARDPVLKNQTGSVGS